MYRMTVENEWGVDITEHATEGDAWRAYERSQERGEEAATRIVIEKV